MGIAGSVKKKPVGCCLRGKRFCGMGFGKNYAKNYGAKNGAGKTPKIRSSSFFTPKPHGKPQFQKEKTPISKGNFKKETETLATQPSSYVLTQTGAN